jgi:hypothetical protein
VPDPFGLGVIDTCAMRRCAAVVLGLFLFFSASVGGGFAQEAAWSVTVVHTSSGQYQVRWQEPVPAERLVVRMQVRSEDGVLSEEFELADFGGPGETWLDLQPLLFGTEPGRCYDATFRVYPLTRAGDAAGPAGAVTLAMCTDAQNNATFPDVPLVPLDPPPYTPASPSDVLVRRDGDVWRLEWRDNSNDETSFDPGAVILDRPLDQGGAAVGGIDLPPVVAGATEVVFDIPASVGGEAPPDGCHEATFLVFSVSDGGAVGLPGSTTVPVCTRGGLFSFPEPDTVDVIVLPEERDLWTPILALAAAGAALALSGTVVRRRAA